MSPKPLQRYILKRLQPIYAKACNVCNVCNGFRGHTLIYNNTILPLSLSIYISIFVWLLLQTLQAICANGFFRNGSVTFCKKPLHPYSSIEKTVTDIPTARKNPCRIKPTEQNENK